MKTPLLVLFSIVGAVNLAYASNNFSYTATADPNAAPDGIDQSSNSVDVWTVTTIPGFSGVDGSGSYYGSQPSLGNAWQLYSYQNDGVGNGGSAFANTTFPGGALTVGQTVSIDFNMRATDPGKQVGLSLLNGSGNAITWGIFGGEPGPYPYTGGGYYYSDAGSSYVSAGSMGYQYQNAIHISITVTGPGTYSATAFNASGSDNWSGTFSGSLIGMQVFDMAAGNGSDVGFNNLKVAPQLTIGNIFPNDGTALFNLTNKFSFSVTGASGASNVINASGIQLTLNGVNVSSNLIISGGGTANVSVSYTNLLLDHVYTGQINVTNVSGVTATALVSFDTIHSTYFTWEAEDYDYGSGQFINSPILSTNSMAGSYFGLAGTEGIDFHDYSADGPKLFRTADNMSTAGADDTARTNFTSAGVPDYNIGYFDGGGFPSGDTVGIDGYEQQEWVNYTRNFPTGTYNIYARIANGNGGVATVPVSLVTSGQGTTNQTTSPLGVFNFPDIGWTAYNFIPMTDKFGNAVQVTLSGTNTLRVLAGSGANINFYMLLPVDTNTPTITSVYPDGSTLVQGTNKLTFTVSSANHSIPQGNVVVTLNGVTNNSLVFTGSASSWNVSVPLTLNVTNYIAVITVTDNVGNNHSTTLYFDTFNPASYDIEAEDWDFGGGQYIDNPVITSVAAPNSYFDQVGTYDVDEDSGDVPVPSTADFRFRENDYIATDLCTDTPTLALVTAQLTNPLAFNYNVAYWSTNGWLNYTHNYPAGNYNVYARLAGNPGSTNMIQLDKVGASTNYLGTFTGVGRGYNSFDWIPLVNTNTSQLATVTLGGLATLRTTTFGNVNPNSYLLVPVVTTPPPLQWSYSAGVLTLSWTDATFHLQAQTNAPRAGLMTNWFNYPGGGTSPANIPVDKSMGSAFYRLSN